MNQLPWTTGNIRYFWINGNADVTGLQDAMNFWESISGIRYVQATSLDQAQIVFVNSDEYKSAFKIDGFIGHSTTITTGDGFGRIAYITVDPAAVEGSSKWTMAETFMHELGHPEGAVDNPGGVSIFNYDNPTDQLSQDDIYYAQLWNGTNPGDDSIKLGDGSAPYSGGFGNDLIYGNRGADTLFGNQGNDTLYGGQEEDSIHGGQGDDVIYGNLGGDVLDGGAGANVLYGGQGDDHLSHGIMYGGLGADTFHIFSEDELVNIKDFNPDQGDTVVREWLFT